MNKYSFDFQPINCKRVYFKELFLLLNSINADNEKYKRIQPKEISKLNIKCENDFNSCKADEFFFENKKQIILGRFFDTIGCFYKCKGHYFSMAMEPYSLFKNDVFIRYIIDKPELYINNSKKIDLEDVFPIRIIVSSIHNIPTYSETKLEDIKEYVYDNIKNKFAISKHNLEMVNNLPDNSVLKHIITERFPINHIISRELCMLYYMKLNFYVVQNEDKSLKSFVLISKYNLKQIKQIYAEYKKPFPNIKYLYNKNKIIKKEFLKSY